MSCLFTDSCSSRQGRRSKRGREEKESPARSFEEPIFKNRTLGGAACCVLCEWWLPTRSSERLPSPYSGTREASCAREACQNRSGNRQPQPLLVILASHKR